VSFNVVAGRPIRCVNEPPGTGKSLVYHALFAIKPDDGDGKKDKEHGYGGGGKVLFTLDKDIRPIWLQRAAKH